MSTRQQPEPGSGCVENVIKDRGITYEQRWVDCHRKNCSRCSTFPSRTPSHGPYWYLCIRADRGWRRVYIGKVLDTGRFRLDNGDIDWPALVAHFSALRKKRATRAGAQPPPPAGGGEPPLTPPNPDEPERVAVVWTKGAQTTNAQEDLPC